MVIHEGESMPGSEPTANNGEAEPSSEQDIEVAASLEHDFRSLIETFDQLLELTGVSDRGTAAALWTAHTAARRGLQLSELLSRVLREKRQD